MKSYSPHSLGGSDIYSEKISKALTKANNEEVIITINPKRGYAFENRDGIKIHRFYPLNISTFHSIGREFIIKQGIWTLLDIYSYYSYKKIKDILKKENPDVVHLHTPIDVTLSAVHAVKSLGLPLVYTLHDYLLLCRRFTLLHGNERMCTNKNINPLCKIYREFTKKVVNDNVDVVISPSEFTLNLHTKEGFFEKTKKIVLPHGIELSDINNKERSNACNKDKICNILYLGGLTKIKGVDILINVFKQIEDKQIKLHIVGGGVYEKYLKRIAKNDNRIIFHGQFSNHEVQKFYTIADIVVIPSLSFEVRCNIIPEAFRAGVPVICSRIGAIPESVKHNYNGFLFKPGDSEQLKEILEGIIENPQKLKKMYGNLYESVKQYEMSKYIDALMKIYEEAIRINAMKN